MDSSGTRRSSFSVIIENCIQSIIDLIANNCSFDELLPMVVNNNLPGEIRSIAWRLFLGILPRNNQLLQWAEISKALRGNFDKLNSDTDLEIYFKVIKNEEDVSALPQCQLTDDFKMIACEMEKISSGHDLFKSKIVAETLQRLILIWRKSTMETDATSLSLQPFYILAGVIYSLYPSILHLDCEVGEINTKEEATPKAIFYFLNNEEFFDGDVYAIFCRILELFQIQKVIGEITTLPRIEKDIIVNCFLEKEDTSSDEEKQLVGKLNRYERISYYYLRVANPGLIKHLMSIQVEVYEIIHSWVSSLLSKIISFENLAYLWENAFICQNSSQMLDCICVSLIVNIANELQSCDKASCESILMKGYPEDETSLKDIIKKAMKIKEKIFEEID